MTVHYLEIVSPAADALVELYQRAYGLAFGPPDPDLGQARVATHADGTLVGIRAPLAAHEQPVVRPYLAVDDLRHAVQQAAAAGATVAYGPTRQGQRGPSPSCSRATSNTAAGNASPPRRDSARRAGRRVARPSPSTPPQLLP